MYRPLPNSLTIKNSDIEGLGLFASEDIPKETKLGVSHMDMKGEVIRTPLGGFYNHSEDPNVEKFMEILKDRTVYVLYTTKDISAGDEITCKYTLYKL